jgi:hypothetical protein
MRPAFPLLVAGAVAFASACGETPRNAADPLPLTGTVLHQSDALGQPSALALSGPYLVVLDGLGAPAVHVLRRTDGVRVAAAGREGEGPGEYRGPRGLQAGAGGSVWVFDVELQRLTRLDLAGLRGDSVPPPAEMVTFGAGVLPMSPQWVGDALVSPGLYDTGRLGWFDRAGRFLRTTGALPPPETGAPPRVVQHAYTGTLAVRPDGARMAVGTRHADRLEIYDAAGTLLHLVRGPRPFEPVFQVAVAQGQPYMASGDELRFGYVDVAATDRAVYALYSGRTRGGAPGVASFGRAVHVYGWDGRLRRTLALDADVLGIAVDEEARRLYATRHDPSPAVLSYPLPPA